MTTEETSSPVTDKSLPKVTDEYNPETGAVEKQSTSGGTITSKYNTLDQLTEYKDAGGNVAKYAYEEGGDGRLEEVSEGKGEEADSYQTYSYNTTTGLMEKLVDSAAGTFTASYDVEGKMTSEIYPNGMCANTTYNSVGEATSLEYIKTRNCTEKEPKVWFSDSIVPSIHGETLQQTSTLSKENYAYDDAGRLLESRETPAGEGCTTRLYAYEEEGDRTSLTTRGPGSEGKCATEGGTVERHTYDEANRLTDEGVEYETFGDITKLPAVDAGTGEGAHELKSTYYVDGQVATQEQSEKMLTYAYDPAGRTETTETKVKGKLESTVTSHYAGSGSALTWTSEGSGKWTRNIPGIGGALDAIQTSSGSPVLQLHDLNGDIVGTASLSESETKLLSTHNSTEFGVPVGGKEPPKYAWLGADGVASELPSGAIAQDGITYVPLTGAPLQTQPVEMPLPINTYKPYVREEDPVESGAIAGARSIAEYWEAVHAAEAAAGGGSGSAPLSGSEMLEGGCSGSGACAASAISCNKKSLFGEGETGVLWLVAAVNCNQKVAGIQIELQIWGLNPHTNKYEMIMNNGTNGQIAYGSPRAAALIKHICAEGLTYKAWAWGYAWGTDYWFSGHGEASGAWKCEGDYAGFGIELAEILD